MPNSSDQDAVQRIDDLPFATVTNETGAEEILHLDVYAPTAVSETLRPAIIWFHGGGFRPGNDKRQRYIPWFARVFAERGYVGIAPDYRLREDPQADFAGTVGDAVADGRAALTWVKANATTYQIDSRRIILAGGSAGGMLVFHLVHDPVQPLGAADGIQAVLSMWGPAGASRRLFEQVSTMSPPTLLVHGTADELVPYTWSQDLAAELSEAGVSNQLLTLPGAPHTPLMHMDQIIDVTAAFLTGQGL